MREWELNLREFVKNYRHPDPLRAWKGIAEREAVCGQDQLVLVDPLDPWMAYFVANVLVSYSTW